MKRLATLSAGLMLGSAALALAAEQSAGSRGIGILYFSFMAAVLLYGVYDSFGKTAMYVMLPIILGGSTGCCRRISRCRHDSADGSAADFVRPCDPPRSRR